MNKDVVVGGTDTGKVRSTKALPLPLEILFLMIFSGPMAVREVWRSRDDFSRFQNMILGVVVTPALGFWVAAILDVFGRGAELFWKSHLATAVIFWLISVILVIVTGVLLAFIDMVNRVDEGEENEYPSGYTGERAATEGEIRKDLIMTPDAAVSEGVADMIRRSRATVIRPGTCLKGKFPDAAKM